MAEPMTAPNRDGLDRVVTFLACRIGPFLDDGVKSSLLPPALRSVRHAVTGVDAYLVAVESGSDVAAHLAGQAAELVGEPGEDRRDLAGLAAPWTRAGQ